MNRNIVAGQSVDSDKIAFSRQLRRSMTPVEALLWNAIRGRNLAGMKFRRQQIIDGYIADLYCAEVGLVVELDGAIHEMQAEYDELRDRVMSARGLKVFRIPNARIASELEKVLGEIARFASHASSIGHPDNSNSIAFRNPESPPLRFGEGAGG